MRTQRFVRSLCCSHFHNYCSCYCWWRLCYCSRNVAYFDFVEYSNWLCAEAAVNHAGNCVDGEGKRKEKWKLIIIFFCSIDSITYHVDVDADWVSCFASIVRFLIEMFINRFSETLSATDRVL